MHKADKCFFKCKPVLAGVLFICLLIFASKCLAGDKQEAALKYQLLEERGKRLALEFKLNEIEKAKALSVLQELSKKEQDQLKKEKEGQYEDVESEK